MTSFGPVSGTVDGPCEFKNGPVTFTQGAAGAGIIIPDGGKMWFVNKNKVTGIAGNGTTPAKAFLTITAGFAALDDYDVLIIAPGNYDEEGTITLTGKKGCKIFGYATGMNWGEGSTTWRDVTSGEDLLELTGCQSIEIAGVSFINSQAFDGINFTGLCYSIEIHHCCFTGDTGGGATGLNAIDGAGSNAPDLYVHDCKFFRYATTGIIMGHQRNVIDNNLFIVANSSIGISLPGAASASYNVVSNNNFLGGATDDYGIYSASSTAGMNMIVDNNFANFDQSSEGEISVSNDANIVQNFSGVASSGGADAQPDPEA